MSTQTHLLRTRRFLPLFLTQFLGAFNDNTFKNALVVLLTFQAAHWTTLAPGLLANLAAGLFILPFFLFSASAGQLADKYDKARLARLVKLLEMAIMVIAWIGFVRESLAWLLVALALLGVHSSLFGPVKYALLPQHLKPDELLGGNALVEAGTFVAILLGTLAGGLLAGSGHPEVIALAGLVVAGFGYLASRSIPAAPAPAPGLRVEANLLASTWRTLGQAREIRSVFLSILGISWFWLFGALFLAQFPAYAKEVLGGGTTAVTLLLATFTIGVGAGSMACERLSGTRVELGLVPFGSLGLSLFALDLALASPSGVPAGAPLGLAALLGEAQTWRILIDLALVGLFGGFFIVPLYALVQLRSPAERRARIIAANNIMNALFMVVGALAAAGALAAGWRIPSLFLAAALVNALVGLYIYTLVPEFLIRFLVWLAMHSIGRVRPFGFAALPAEGPALLVLAPARPLGLADLLLVLAASPRPVRCVVEPGARGFYRWFLRETGAIQAGPDSATAIADALAAGQVVLAPAGMVLPEVPGYRLALRATRRKRAGLLPPPSVVVLAPVRPIQATA